LWGWGVDKKKIVWVKWAIICKSRFSGDLGIKIFLSLVRPSLVSVKWRPSNEEKGCGRKF